MDDPGFFDSAGDTIDQFGFSWSMRQGDIAFNYPDKIRYGNIWSEWTYD